MKKKESNDLKDNYVVVQSWMVRDLGLKGNMAILYALIYGFSQTEKQACTCGIEYMQKWIGGAKSTIIRALNKLENDGLIYRIHGCDNDARVTGYVAIRPTKKGSETTPIMQILGSRMKPKMPEKSGEIGSKTLPKKVANCNKIGRKMLPPSDNNNYNIYNIPDLSVSHSARAREDGTDGQTDITEYFVNIAKERMKDAGIDSELDWNASKLLALFREIGRRKELRVNGAPIDKTLLLQNLLALCDSKSELYRAFAKGECTDDGESPKNKFGYMITTLYNYVNNF